MGFGTLRRLCIPAYADRGLVNSCADASRVSGGKLKPLKAPKKADKDLSAEDIAFQQKQKAEAAALKALKGQIADKGFVKAKVGGKK